MFRILGAILGAFLVIAGVPLTLSPVPLGLLMIGAGVILLAAASPPFARWLERRRARHHRLDAVLDKAAETLPDPIAEPLERTDPKTRREADGEADPRPIRRMEPGEDRRGP